MLRIFHACVCIVPQSSKNASQHVPLLMSLWVSRCHPSSQLLAPHIVGTSSPRRMSSTGFGIMIVQKFPFFVTSCYSHMHNFLGKLASSFYFRQRPFLLTHTVRLSIFQLHYCSILTSYMLPNSSFYCSLPMLASFYCPDSVGTVKISPIFIHVKIQGFLNQNLD